MKLYQRAGQWHFLSQSGEIEYGPFDRSEARRQLRQYMQFLAIAGGHRAVTTANLPNRAKVWRSQTLE